jgi:Mg2+/Co2+ transporter CorC
MSNTPIAEDELPVEEDRKPDEETSWFDRLLATFGLGEEPDLRELIEDALARSTSDTLSAQERSMLRRILRFGKLTVEDVMVPRADIIAVEDNLPIDEMMRVFRQAEHSRLPVFHETLDDPRGMVHIRDLMSWITSQAEAAQANGLDLGQVALRAGLDGSARSPAENANHAAASGAGGGRIWRHGRAGLDRRPGRGSGWRNRR